MATGARFHRYRPWLLGLAVALLGSAASILLARQQAQLDDAMSRARAVEAVNAFTDALTRRIDAYTEIVYGLRGLFVVDPTLSRAAFDRAVRQLDVQSRYPGIKNFAFTRRVEASRRAAYEAAVQADRSLDPRGYPDFRIHPLGDRSEYFVAEYLWPLAGNEGVLGLDISAQPANLAAMQYARLSGRPVASAPFDLVQETEHRAGFVIRVPVFAPASGGPDAPEDMLGAVAVTVRIYDVVRAIEREGRLRGLEVVIRDAGSALPGAATTSPVLLYGATNAGPSEQARTLQVHGRRWALDFRPAAPFLSPSERQLPFLIGGAGSAVSLLIGVLAVLLAKQHSRALEDSEGRFRALFNQAAVGVAQVDSASGRFVQLNEKYARILGYCPAELQTLDFRTVTHPDDVEIGWDELARLRAGELREFRVEKRYLHKDGHTVWVALTVTPLWAPGAPPDYHMTMAQDITERKRMELQWRAGEERLRTILQRLPVAILVVDQNDVIALRNERFAQLSGYGPEETPTLGAWRALAYPDEAYRDQVALLWQDARETAQREGTTIGPVEVEIVCKGGERRAIEVAGIVIGTDYLVTLSDLTEHKAHEQEIKYLAFYDPLTRLPNRRLLIDRLQQALATSVRRQRHGALLFIDLDNFKTLNDTLGHDKGDLLLQQVADRLTHCVREGDTVARQGGDEFVVVLEDLSGAAEEAAAHSEAVGQKILQALNQVYVLAGYVHHSTPSIGITLFYDQKETVDELLKRADLAMYQAKGAGRNTLRFYDPQMQALVSARASLELSLRAGLAGQQFELFYQPQVDAGRVTGAEALLRWRHPQQGFVSPAHFIPLAEDTGLILPLGQWVLETACSRLAEWAGDTRLAGLTLAINVSPRQFRQSDFVDQVRAALNRSGANPRRLKLELTEGLLLDDVEGTVAKMSALNALGMSFSLDDFGTGYSSLSYLKRLPLAQIKIDQGFVRDVLSDANDAAIARTIVALASSLGLAVIAEGVETEAQREFLAREGCHAYQGYLFSPPLPLPDFEALMRRQG